jgi:hypothetical protein
MTHNGPRSNDRANADRNQPVFMKLSEEIEVAPGQRGEMGDWFGWNPSAGQFRPPTNRFDAPDRSYGILYAAATRDGSFAETIGRKPGTFRSNDELAGLAMITLALTKELRLVDVNGGAGSASSLNLFAHSSSRTPP